MQARVVKSSRYGIITAFNGIEFVKHEWRRVPAQFEESARTHDLLEVREGKAEKEVVQKQAEEQAPKFLRARLVETHERESLRTLGGLEFTKDTWLEVPAGSEDSARRHEALQLWEIGEDEPGKVTENKKRSGRKYGVKNKEEEGIETEGEG